MRCCRTLRRTTKGPEGLWWGCKGLAAAPALKQRLSEAERETVLSAKECEHIFAYGPTFPPTAVLNAAPAPPKLPAHSAFQCACPPWAHCYHCSRPMEKRRKKCENVPIA